MIIARRAGRERAVAAAWPAHGARQRLGRRRRSKVRRKNERAYVNIGTFTSERVHQSGALTQRCAGTSPVRFLRCPIEKFRTSFRVHHLPRVCAARRGRRSTAALLSPHHCWCIYRLIIELVCVTITRQLGKRAALWRGGSLAARMALPRLRRTAGARVASRAAAAKQ